MDSTAKEKRPDIAPANGNRHFDPTSPDSISFAGSKDYDETYEVYKQQDARDIDPLEAKRVLHKIDLHILPFLMITYMLQYLDKSSINFAVVYGLEDDLNLSGTNYDWCVKDTEHDCTRSVANNFLKAIFDILLW